MTINPAIRYLLPVLLAALIGCAARPAAPALGNRPPEGSSPAPRTAPSAEAEAIYSYLAAREFLQEQKPEEAMQALERAVAIEPTPELYIDLGNLYWRASRFSDALLLLRQGLDKYPDSELLLSTLAKTYAAQGRYDDAVLVLDDYRKNHPEQLDLVHEAAVYRMEQGKFGEAVDRLSAIPENKATPTTDFLLGKGYFGLGLFDKAIAAFQQSVAADPEYYDAWIEMGLTYEAQKNYVDAERVFSQLFDAGIENQQIVFRLVDLNLKLNNPDKSLALVQQYSDDLPLTLEAANLFLTLSFYDHAAQLLDPLAQQPPIPESALFYLAILEYEGRDNPDKAREYLEAIPVNHPHHERSLIFRIHILYHGGDKEGARRLCQTAMGLFPRQPEFRIVMAELHEREGEFDQALEVLKQAQAQWPENMTILYRSGLVHDRKGDRGQAMAVMEQVIAKDPEHADALNFLGYSLAEEGRDLGRALLLVQGALKVKPDNGYFVDSLAWVYFKQKKLKPAWDEIRRAVELADSDPVIWEHYGDIARALNLVSEARKGYSRSLELEGDNADAVRAKLNELGHTR
jgi:tetratricopeptide (TPR) repeat protein